MSLYLKTLPQPSRIMKDVPLTEALTDSTYKVLLPSKFFNNTAFDVCQPLLSPKQKTLFHFNPRAGGSAAQERPAKRIKIESSDKATMEEVSKLVDPLLAQWIQRTPLLGICCFSQLPSTLPVHTLYMHHFLCERTLPRSWY